MFAAELLKPVLGHAFKKLIDQIMPSELDQALDNAVREWVRSLPVQFSDTQPEAMLKDLVVEIGVESGAGDNPWFSVCQLIASRTIPARDLWFDALKERRERVHKDLKSGAQMIFAVESTAVNPLLFDLAKRLELACANCKELFNSDTHQRLTSIESLLIDIKGLISSPNSSPTPTIDFWPINGRGRNVVTGRSNMQKGHSGIFNVTLQFAIRSSVKQSIRRIEIDYFLGSSKTEQHLPIRRYGHIDGKGWDFRLDGHLEPAMECEPSRVYNFAVTLELLGQNEPAGPIGTDYGSGRILIEGTDARFETPFFLNPGGIMLLHEADWHGHEPYYYD